MNHKASSNHLGADAAAAAAEGVEAVVDVLSEVVAIVPREAAANDEAAAAAHRDRETEQAVTETERTATRRPGDLPHAAVEVVALVVVVVATLAAADVAVLAVASVVAADVVATLVAADVDAVATAADVAVETLVDLTLMRLHLEQSTSEMIPRKRPHPRCPRSPCKKYHQRPSGSSSRTCHARVCPPRGRDASPRV